MPQLSLHAHNDPSTNTLMQSFQPATLRFRERPAAERRHFPKQIAQGDLVVQPFPMMFDLYHVIAFPYEIEASKPHPNYRPKRQRTPPGSDGDNLCAAEEIPSSVKEVHGD